jgi:branched-subunit amino acid transport protein
MSTWMLIVIAGMAIATYVPRALPLLFLKADRIPPRFQAILGNVPYAALGALIIPGVFTFHDDPWFGVVGALTAVLTAWLGGNLVVVVGSSIVVLTLYSLLQAGT